MISGDKEKIALEVIRSKEAREMGKIFLYVNNMRFGIDTGLYNVDEAISNVVENFHVHNFDCEKLIECPRDVLLGAYDTAFEEGLGSDEIDSELIERYSGDEINLYCSEFYLKFSESNELDNCFFRLGNYMFDTTSLIVIPKNDSIRLFVRDDMTGDSTDIYTTAKDFINLWIAQR